MTKVELHAGLQARATAGLWHGDGELARLYTGRDWSQTPLGPVANWPEDLRSTLRFILNARFPMFITWGQGRTVLYNEAYAQVLGRKHPQALGSPFASVWAEIWLDIVGLIEQVDRGEAVYIEDLRLILNRNGYDEETYFTFSYSPMRGPQGEVTGLFCACVETTARKQSEEGLKIALESARMGTWRLDLQSGRMQASEQLAQLFDLTRTEWDLQAFLAVTVHPDDRAEVATAIAAAVATGEPYQQEFRNLAPLGEVRWFASRGTVLYSEQGRALSMSGTSHNITDQRLAQMALERSARLVEEMPQPFFAVDAQWTLHTWNPAAAAVVGLSQAGVVGRKLWDVFPGLEHSAFGDSYRRTVKEQVNLSCEAFYEHFRKWYEVWTFPFEDGVGVAFFDITSRKEAESNLAAAKDEAERASALKSAFLANMSHEIRTPLGAMLGFTDLLRDPSLSAKERISYLDILKRNGEQLSVLINDILDLSKVEAGHLTLEWTRLQPAQTVAELVSLLGVTAEEKHLQLSYQCDESTPAEVVSDPFRTRQILLNLLSNAIKFTHHGTVTVRSYGERSATRGTTVAFTISDRGIGIPAAERERIFDVFVQADGSTSRRFGGTGLGLALSRRLAQALGGDVTLVRSEEGVGSTFLFVMPDQPERQLAHLPQPAPTQEPVPTSLAGTRILVVDDAADNRHLLRRRLSRTGAAVETAENGRVGVEMALAGHFDVILMDLQMPEMDGYVATQKLRDQGFRQPVIALTAHAMSETRIKCLNVGCNDHLAKPIDFNRLIATISRHLRSANS